ncbi:class I SAM-dependent RNA methyltransferase [Granulicoccus phenolivorans]|uniref:class I SAM-dependent RNA methyltransferase n=1 Tax=Granulicoccus phenolivorans TaxID=266854 RepID=UPI00040AF065|nr:methyltransferase [Granulicoccus phenolivorans]
MVDSGAGVDSGTTLGATATTPAVGEIVGPLPVGPIAHGGHCVARYQARVVFVRHALPGEEVLVRITDTSHARYWLGDAVEIRTPAPERIPSACPVAGPGGCGGCDFAHVDPAFQRELKRRVVAEQLQRLAGIEWSGEVAEVAPTDHWRTRMRYRVSGGELGQLAHHSHTVIPLPQVGCRIAAGPAPSAAELGVADLADLAPDIEVRQIEAASGRVVHTGAPAVDTVTETAAGIDFEVPTDGFWQIHPRSADTLVAAVLAGLDPRAGERGFDLYCGVGLFAGALAARGVTMWGVESDKDAVSCARRNVRAARFTSGRVDRVLSKLPHRTDLVVLDPPRSGAGKQVIQQVAARTPRAIAYVACDPAALARDLAYAAAAGYQPDSITAYDLFGWTHHVECVAILHPA